MKLPVCFVVVSEEINELKEDSIQEIRSIVAEGLNSKSRRLDKNHISLRMLSGERRSMLADIEVEVFAQIYLRRLFSRDKRSQIISQKISTLLDHSCATWINLHMVGYSRVVPGGDVFFSDSDNRLIAMVQRIRGISTRKKRI